MRALAGSQFSDSVLRNLWVQRLPPTAQAILTCSAGDLDSIAQTADRVVAALPFSQAIATVAKVDQPPHPESNNSIAPNPDLQMLAQEVAELRRHVYQQTRERLRTPAFRPSGSSRGQPDVHMCWYHRRFGSQARQCVAPCSFRNRRSNSVSEN